MASFWFHSLLNVIMSSHSGGRWASAPCGLGTGQWVHFSVSYLGITTNTVVIWPSLKVSEEGILLGPKPHHNIKCCRKYIHRPSQDGVYIVSVGSHLRLNLARLSQEATNLAHNSTNTSDVLIHNCMTKEMIPILCFESLSTYLVYNNTVYLKKDIIKGRGPADECH